MAESAKHWSGIAEAGSLLGMKTLLLAYRIFGRWGFRLILLPVMSYYYLTRKPARAASREYLEHLTASTPTLASTELTPFRHFWSFSEILLDKLLVWMGHIKREDVIFEEPERFRELDASVRGGVIVVSHLGNTEVCSAIAHQLPDIRVTMLVYTRHAEKFNSLMQKTGSQAAVNMMQVTEMSPATAMILSERIEAGEYIVIAGDRTPVGGQGRTSVVNFLGAPAAMPQGAFILASLLRCPVYLMFCLKREQRYHIYLEKFADHLVFERRRRCEQLNEAVQHYADRLGYYCRLAPLQWFNFFPFWQAGAAPGREVARDSSAS
jgi:predicted LPLAT superfamily acyltransferase